MLKKIKTLINPNSDPRNFLLNEMPQNSVCAEIGSWKGEFTSKILKRVNPKKLYMLDPYSYVSDYKDAWYGGVSGSQKAMDEVFSSVAKKFHNEIENNTIEMVRDNSSNSLPKFEDAYFDWVYIDGNHLYDFVMEDLKLSWQKVKIGGFVTGDDYNLKGWWDDGVTKAVDEFIEMKKNSIGKTYIKETQFIIEKIAD